MNDYIVRVFDKHPISYNEWFLVKASNKKEAVDKVHARLGKEYFKKDLKAYSLTEFYKDKEVACIH